jgi:hypothetical protein
MKANNRTKEIFHMLRSYIGDRSSDLGNAGCGPEPDAKLCLGFVGFLDIGVTRDLTFDLKLLDYCGSCNWPPLSRLTSGSD